MALGDYFNGPKYKAKAEQLNAELQMLRQQTQDEIHGLNSKFNDLDAKVRQNGMLNLIEIQDKFQQEEVRLRSVQAQVANVQNELQTARTQLQVIQQQILGAEDAVLLESFALYEPKYQFTNSVDYKKRLEEIGGVA